MPRKKITKKNKGSGIAKIATFTASSISSAYSSYKKKLTAKKALY